MNPPSIPWISVTSIADFFQWLFSAVGTLFRTVTGTGDPIVVFYNFPLYVLDILLATTLAIFIVTYLYLSEKLGTLEAERQSKIDAKYIKPAPVEIKYSRWDAVTLLVRSQNENDWKQAIIDCDSMLDQLLSQLGYTGETLGEKLKQCNKANFPDLDDAWTAHKVRNQIAHPSAGFRLDQRLALHTYYLYERVFRNSGFILQ